MNFGLLYKMFGKKNSFNDVYPETFKNLFLEVNMFPYIFQALFRITTITDVL